MRLWYFARNLCRTPGGNACDAVTSQCSTAFEFTLLTFCPPGPPLRANEKSNSVSLISMFGGMRSMKSLVPFSGRGRSQSDQGIKRKPSTIPVDGPCDAERAGFEPAVQFDPDTSLAMMRIRPLCHLSVAVNCRAVSPEGDTIYSVAVRKQAQHSQHFRTL